MPDLNLSNILELVHFTDVVRNVHRFGAVGDNVVDDTTAIQNAIDSITTLEDSTGDGGVVFFPPGRYLISDTIEVPPNVWLIGTSPSFSTNLANQTASTIEVSHDGTAVRLVRRNASSGNLFHRGGVLRLGFSGTGTSATTDQHLVELGDDTDRTTSTGAWNVTVRDCTFKNSDGYGIYAAHTQHADISFNYFDNIKIPVFYPGVVAMSRICHNHMTLGSATDSGSIGVLLYADESGLGGSAGVVISDNYFFEFEVGLYMASIKGAHVRGNTFEGLDSTARGACHLTKFETDDSTEDGNGCEGCVIEGNTFIDWHKSAVGVNYSRGNQVLGNLYRSPDSGATNAIDLVDDVNDTVEDNIIYVPVVFNDNSVPAIDENDGNFQDNVLIHPDWRQWRNLSSDPTTTNWGNGEKGRMWYNSTDDKFKFWNGSAIETVTSS